MLPSLSEQVGAAPTEPYIQTAKTSDPAAGTRPGRFQFPGDDMANSSDGLRRYPRKRFFRDVLVMDEEGYGFLLEADNLSRGGVFLKTSLLLDEGQDCVLRVELDDGRKVRARGHVCRANSSAHSRYPSGIAISFDYLDDNSRSVLESVTPAERVHVVS